MNPTKTTIDWLRFRSQSEPCDGLEALRPMFGDYGHKLRLQHLDRGMLGFRSGALVALDDMTLGRVDFGGESQRGWCRWDISGKGCEWVQDWTAAHAVEALPKAQIRRLDIALTTWAGEVCHDQVVSAHQAGRFVTRGRPPVMTQITSSDKRAGRTCYIGKREKADKFMRCYEKGMQIMQNLLADVSLDKVRIEGSRPEDIYRCEVELKAVNTDIPWEVIERRDQYFAGAYPFCADVLPGIEADILKRRPERQPQTELAIALENCKRQFGPTIFTAMVAYGGDLTSVWDRIVGTEHNSKLLEAGVLLVEHE
jgi:DNA relaxase NicK